jgi:hypothetical protein
MIFTGKTRIQSPLPLPHDVYGALVFESASAILPFLERRMAEFCASTAPRLQCHVAAGYRNRTNLRIARWKKVAFVDVVGTNTAVVYGPNGTCVAHCRKSHLSIRTSREKSRVHRCSRLVNRSGNARPNIRGPLIHTHPKPPLLLNSRVQVVCSISTQSTHFESA